MAFITRAEARSASPTGIYLSESELRKAAASPASTQFDVFLSHSLADAEVILGVKEILEREQLTVYVDWIADPQADRSAVTPATADLLRNRMKHCRFLLYASSNASPDSKWMPWELGYFDGLRPGKVGILPIVESSLDSFRGQEYLGLYPTFEMYNFTGLGMKLGRSSLATNTPRLATLARS